MMNDELRMMNYSPFWDGKPFITPHSSFIIFSSFHLAFIFIDIKNSHAPPMQ